MMRSWFPLLAIELGIVLFRGEATPLVRSWSKRTHARHVPLRVSVDAAGNAWVGGFVTRVNSTASECEKSIRKHPDEISCPPQCPFLRADASQLCHFQCVPEEKCGEDNPLASYANKETMRCEACVVPACKQCGASANTCEVCQDGFEAVKGGKKCETKSRFGWYVLFVVLGLITAFLVVYLVALFMRPLINMRAFEAGLQFRRFSATRDVENDRQYPVATDLRNQSVTGIAVMLHFRFQYMVTLWAVFGLVLFAILAIIFQFYRRKQSEATNGSKESFEACNHAINDAHDTFETMEVIYFLATGAMYIITFAGTLWFGLKQRRFFRQERLKEDLMGDYALLVSGLPRMEGPNVERDLTSFFKGSPAFKDVEVVGVSPCWDFRNKQDAVNRLIDRWLDSETLDMHRAPSYREASSAASLHRSSRHCCDFQLKCVDAALGIGNCPCMQQEEHEPELVVGRLEDDAAAVVKEIQSSGYAFVVLGTRGDLDKALRQHEESPLEYDGQKLGMKHLVSEPDTVRWQGYGCSDRNFYAQLVLGCVAIGVAIVLLDAFFYAPYVVYIMAYSNVAGITQGTPLTATLLGLLITVCNQCIYYVILVVAQKCSWHNTDKQMRFYVVQYTLAVFANTILDLGTVVVLAQGFSLDQTMKMQAANDSTVSVKALAESPNIQKALYDQLVLYIFPSCMLTPFILEPIFTTLVPYFLSAQLVKTRKEVTPQAAERCLQCNPYDLSRYGDIMINVMLCCCTLVFTYPDMFKIFLYMIISMIVIYVWDQLRVLRFTTRTFFATCTLENTVQHLEAMPVAIIAACLMFRVYSHAKNTDRGKNMLEKLAGASGGKLSDLPGMATAQAATDTAGRIFDSVVSRRTIIVMMLLVAFVHMAVHWLLIHYWVAKKLPKGRQDNPDDVVPEDEFVEGSSYKNLNEKFPSNWFNTNPVHCLRSRFLHQHSPPCMYYRPGKEFLVVPNPELGVYYDGELHRERTMSKDKEREEEEARAEKEQEEMEEEQAAEGGKTPSRASPTHVKGMLEKAKRSAARFAEGV